MKTNQLTAGLGNVASAESWFLPCGISTHNLTDKNISNELQDFLMTRKNKGKKKIVFTGFKLPARLVLWCSQPFKRKRLLFMEISKPTEMQGIIHSAPGLLGSQSQPGWLDNQMFKPQQHKWTHRLLPSSIFLLTCFLKYMFPFKGVKEPVA